MNEKEIKKTEKVNIKEEVKNKMNLLLNILENAMKTTGIEIGWDLESQKLVLRDIETDFITRIALQDLNKVVRK